MDVQLASPILSPLGLSFEIPDLLLAEAFAASCSFRMVVELHHHTDAEEMEEVIALYGMRSEACRCLIWREATAIVVQPMLGRPRRFDRLSDALEWLIPAPPVAVNDIHGDARF